MQINKRKKQTKRKIKKKKILIFTGWCKSKTERKGKKEKEKKNNTKDWKKSLRWKIKEIWLGSHEELYITKVFRTKSKSKCSGSNCKT